MKRMTRIGALVGGVVTLLSMAAPAMATPPTGSNGFDELPNVIVAGGSDTSYQVSNLLGTLYNQSEGCDTNNTVAPADGCAPTVVGGRNDPNDANGWRQTLANKYANWDHDQLVNAFPIGSGSGRNCLAGTLACTNPVDVVRSSSGLGNAALNSQYAFAFENVAVVAANPSVKARTTGTLAANKTQLQALYGPAPACGTITWADLGDTGANSADVVVPFGMNPGSGTFGTFQTYLGVNPNNGGCVVGQPFENDVEELQSAPMSTAYGAGTGLWWISGATLTNYPVQSRTLSGILVDGAALYGANGVPYPSQLVRNVSYVTLDSDVPWCGTAAAPIVAPTVMPAGCTAAQQNVAGLGGTSLAKQGAVRNFIRFLCTAPGATTQILDRTVQNNTTGTRFDLRISSQINLAGFKPLTGANFGRCIGST